MAGVAMNTTVLGHALVEPGYEPVFAELNRQGARCCTCTRRATAPARR